MGRGLAEQLGAIDPKGRGFGLDRLRDVGLDVTGYMESDNQEIRTWEKLPPGHEFFPDCMRETNAQKIKWVLSTNKGDGWFATLTFKNYVTVGLANRLMLSWIEKLQASYRDFVGSGWLNWVCASEWQKRNVIHFHLIISGVGLGSLSRKRWEARWMGMFRVCGFARIYDARTKSAPYLAKYTSKSLNGDLQWCRTWQGLSAPRSLMCCERSQQLVSKAELPGHPPTDL